jgi:hypothetical protein
MEHEENMGKEKLRRYMEQQKVQRKREVSNRK